MSPTVFGCVICGYSVGSVSGSWVDQFRIVFSHPQGTFLSDVGHHSTDETYSAPILEPRHGPDSFQNEIPVMTQPPRNGQHGFVVHDACWSLLQKSFQAREIPLERLLAIFRSLPYPLRGIGVCWGHSYGGLFNLDEDNHYPWEDRLMDSCANPNLLHSIKTDPFKIPEISEMRTPAVEASSIHDLTAHNTGSFEAFPWEIINAIAALLPTDDALSLARSCKGLLPLLDNQAFWASRFQVGGEYDFIFERSDGGKAENWKLRYSLVRRISALPSLRNRRRIWSFVQGISDLLRLRAPVLASASKYGRDRSWRVVNGDIRRPSAKYGESFNEGCQIFQYQRALVSRNLSNVAFSVVKIEGYEYVAGIRLVSCDGTNICLGYIDTGNELLLEVTKIRGMLVAIGSRGVRAIQVINGEREISQWFGCPRDCAITNRLAKYDFLSELEVGIDGYKLVSLAATGPGADSSSNTTTTGSFLRSTALWYPTVPPHNLDLNDSVLTGNQSLDVKYRPLCWIRFGGQSGVDLRSLTGLSVTRLGGLCDIEFHYEAINITRNLRRLGRRCSTEFSDALFFAIDGPGGEIISSVETTVEYKDGMDVYDFYKQGKLHSFKITTNRNRDHHFQPKESLQKPFETRSLVVASENTITGFYASQHPEFGLVSLGVLSENIQDLTVSKGLVNVCN